MRFKIDENLPVEIAVLLRDAGHSADTAHEEGLAGRPDEAVSQVCRDEARALITLDLDFGDIRAYPPEDHAGIVVLRPRNQDKLALLALARQAIALLPTEPLEGRIWIVQADRVRIR